MESVFVKVQRTFLLRLSLSFTHTHTHTHTHTAKIQKQHTRTHTVGHSRLSVCLSSCMRTFDLHRLYFIFLTNR